MTDDETQAFIDECRDVASGDVDQMYPALWILDVLEQDRGWDFNCVDVRLGGRREAPPVSGHPHLLTTVTQAARNARAEWR